MPDAPVNWSEVDHVLLDMDGTVLDLSFDNRFWRELVPQRYADTRGISLAQAAAELEPRFRALQGTLEWYCLEYWSWVTTLHLPTLKEEVRHWIAPLAGSEDFLRAVKASGRDPWLVTNAHGSSWSLKMRETGFGHWFDRIVCAHDFAVPKEDARFWPRLAAAHPFNPKRALFVDDSLPVLRSARDYGIGQVVAIRHPDTTREPRAITEFPAIDGLRDLKP